MRGIRKTLKAWTMTLKYLTSTTPLAKTYIYPRPSKTKHHTVLIYHVGTTRGLALLKNHPDLYSDLQIFKKIFSQYLILDC